MISVEKRRGGECANERREEKKPRDPKAWKRVYVIAIDLQSVSQKVSWSRASGQRLFERYGVVRLSGLEGEPIKSGRVTRHG
jgi:hypothetical protein